MTCLDVVPCLFRYNCFQLHCILCILLFRYPLYLFNHGHCVSEHCCFILAKVVEKIKRVYGAELCTIAWCKFHEILATGEVLPADLFSHQRPFYSVHLCEGPGSFITSLNHYLATRGENVCIDQVDCCLE